MEFVGIVSKYMSPLIPNTAACSLLGHPRTKDFIKRGLQISTQKLVELGILPCK